MKNIIFGKSNFCRLMVVVLLIGSMNHVNAQATKAKVPTIKLNNGMEMPKVGIGTFAISYEQAKAACLEAFKNGFRHVDCATAYRVEGAVGEAMKESGIPREEFFIASKLWVSDYSDGKTLASIDTILKRFQTDYIDLLYIHQPIGDYVNAGKRWKRPSQPVKCVHWESVILMRAKNVSITLSIT